MHCQNVGSLPILLTLIQNLQENITLLERQIRAWCQWRLKNKVKNQYTQRVMQANLEDQK